MTKTQFLDNYKLMYEYMDKPITGFIRKNASVKSLLKLIKSRRVK